MKTLTTVLGLAVLLVVAGTAAGGPYMEQFGAGAANWQVWQVNDAGNQTENAPTYLPSAGGSGGCISAPLGTDAYRLYDLQPENAALYQGLAGLSLTTDFKLNGVVTGPAKAEVRFYVGTFTGGNNYFVSNDTFSWDPNSDTQWTTHTVSLLAQNFVVWPNQAANNMTFDQVVAAPGDIGLVFCGNFTSNSTLGFSGTGNILIDNFGAVGGSPQPMPEPATLVLFGAGAAVLVGRRRRRRAVR